MRKDSATATLLWFALGVALLWNLPDLRLPPHGEHAWRDADGLGVARSFLHDGWNPLLPRVAERGNLTGIVGMELPLLNWLGAAAMRVLGERDWVCRALVLLSLVPLAFGFRRLARQLLPQPAAADLATAFLLLEPLVLVFSHKFMPEVPMLAFLVWGGSLALAGMAQGRRRDFALAALCLSLAAVLKPTGVAVAVPLALRARRRFSELLATDRTAAFRMAWQVILTALAPLASAALWFSYAHRLETTYGLPLFRLSNDWFEWARLLPDPNFEAVILGRWLHLYLLLPTCLWIAFEWRVALAVLREHIEVSTWLAAGFVVVLLFGSHNFQHSYYALPLLLPIALFLGEFVLRASDKRAHSAAWRTIFVVIFAATGIVRALPRFRKLTYDPARIEAALHLLPTGLIVATDQRTPVVSLVILHRCGWSLPAETLDPTRLAALRGQGATLLVESTFGGWLTEAQRSTLPPPLYQDDQLRAYDLSR